MIDLLKTIDGPPDLRELPEERLPELCAEIREFLLDSVFHTGGHLSANLGSVELTVALHYAFDFLEDRMVWDVGHQAYTHKILTGRRDRFHTQRCTGGLSGFTNPLESPYDQFMGGHAGTSISTGLGLASAIALKGESRKTVVVIGDASIGAGMALEGLNMTGVSGMDMLIVLNDNRMSISKTVGSLSTYLTKMRTMPLYSSLKQDLQVALASVPLVGDRLSREVERVMETLKYYVVPGHFFEELGLKYFGPYDGHDVEGLVKSLKDVKRHRGPAILHLLTEKGKGYKEAEADPIKFHGVSPINPRPKEKVKGPENGVEEEVRPSWTRVFSDSLIRLATEDERVVAITAAMPGGTGTDRFQKCFPERFIDVGICEQHAVGMAAGLTREGLLPVVAIYSTFLQRAYDQVFHDVVLNGRPVMFCMDRGGLVGADGWSHHGLYDISYLRAFPRITLLAPRDGLELLEMMRYAAASDEICAIRYPRGSVPPTFGPARRTPIEKGRAELIRKGGDGAILAYGAMVHTAHLTAEILAERGIHLTVVNARFANPVDGDLLLSLAAEQPYLVTLEEGALAGGFGSAVIESLADAGVPSVRVKRLGVPNELIDHAAHKDTMVRLGLTPDALSKTVEGLLHEKTSRPAW
jgi:1-deoxy-D-xylulose-5-phosphate synthase